MTKSSKQPGAKLGSSMHSKVPELARKTFRQIEHNAAAILWAAIAAKDEPNEKKRDKLMVKIMDLNEEIENLYSCNYH